MHRPLAHRQPGFTRLRPTLTGLRRACLPDRQGFTLVELLMSIGVLGVLSSIVIIAINPSKHLLAAFDAMRRYNAERLERAIKQYGIAESEYPKGDLIPLRECEAVPVCAQGVTTDPGCLNLDAELTPLFVAHIPQDSREPNPSYSGFKIYRSSTSVEAIPMHLGQLIPFSTISSELIARWTFDEESGIDVPDATGCGNNGVLLNNDESPASASHNTSDVPPVGFANPRSLNLEENTLFGANGVYARIPNTSDLDEWQNGQTVSLWVKPKTGYIHYYDRIIEKGANTEWSIVFDDSANGPAGARIYLDEALSLDGNDAGPTSNITENQWHHIAAVFTSTFHLSIYVDGVLDPAAQKQLAFYTSTNGGDISIGRFGNTQFNTNSSIDDIRIYTRELSLEEIQMIAAGEG